MIARFNTKEFQDGLKVLKLVVSSNPPYPIIRNVLLESAGDGSVSILGIDGDIKTYAKVVLPTKAEVFGVCLNFKELYSLVNNCKLPYFDLRIDDDTVTFTSNGTLAGLETSDAADFPLMPNCDDVKSWVEVSPEIVGYALNRIIPCLSKDDMRPVLQSCYLDLKDGKMVGTDGHIITTYSNKQLNNLSKLAQDSERTGVLMNPVLCNALKSFWNKSIPAATVIRKSDKLLKIGVDTRADTESAESVWIQYGNVTLCQRYAVEKGDKSTLRYPRYKSVIPNKEDIQFALSIQISELLPVLRELDKVIPKDTHGERGALFDVNPNDSKVTITAYSFNHKVDYTTVREFLIHTDENFPPFKICFGVKLLMGAISKMDPKDMVHLEFIPSNGKISPSDGIFLSTRDSNFLTYVMPVRIK